MAIEIEKKYRLTDEQRDVVIARLNTLNAESFDAVFEVNTIYRSPRLEQDRAILRLRRIGDRSILTYKKRLASPSAIKHQLKEETEIENGDVMENILAKLGLTSSIIYEKRRTVWKYSETEIALDELPFGKFMEIEGTEENIKVVERELRIENLPAEESTYVGLTHKLGVRNGELIEARFAPERTD